MDQQPTLLFDGACGFCRVQARRAERLAGARVRVAPFDPRSYPNVPAAEARAAVQFIDVDGSRSAGADAIVAFWRRARPRLAFLAHLYALPGVAPLARRAYARVARRRRWG
jgi:predicted DCC family thiol-disulfide oxidoreductase YuxK